MHSKVRSYLDIEQHFNITFDCIYSKQLNEDSNNINKKIRLF